MSEDNLLSLSYGRIVRKDIQANDGLLPESFETYQIIKPGDVVLRLTDLQNDKRSLRSALVEERGIITSAYLAIQPTKVESHFLAYLLRTYDLTKVFYSMGGGLRQSMKFTDMKRMPMVIPSHEEQAGIADFLDRETGKIDALIAEQNKLLTLLAEKRQATISHAVTRGLNPDAPMKDSGVAWLGEVPEHWGNSKKLLDLAHGDRHSFVNGPFGSDLLTSELVGEGVPVIYIRDIKLSGYLRVSEWCVTPEKAEQLKFCNVIPGDVLVAKVGDPPGLATVYPQGEVNGIVTQDVIRLRVDPVKASAEYVRWLLNSKYGQTQIDHISVESTRTRVGLGEYKQLRFFVPPLHEQTAIADFLEAETTKLDALKAEAERVIDLLKERRGALIAAAVTGKIDVRNAVPQELAA
ncbi:restriction endonuclease subunit S [Burkholderia seminalis]|uniref:Restriction endonuclease subunit S n=2 Tax=Burkholderia cepacia complex TaxID=87882 RepID=A0A8A8D254_9BURK|nr:restriction endonuclease subunit S [Burkholderia seminalis]QTO18689.1 restriction endonuclease subunit S [Burkholderia seminalis]